MDWMLWNYPYLSLFLLNRQNIRSQEHVPVYVNTRQAVYYKLIDKKILYINFHTQHTLHLAHFLLIYTIHNIVHLHLLIELYNRGPFPENSPQRHCRKLCLFKRVGQFVTTLAWVLITPDQYKSDQTSKLNWFFIAIVQYLEFVILLTSGQ